MTEPPLKILCVIGTSAAKSATPTVVGHIARRLRTLGQTLMFRSKQGTPVTFQSRVVLFGASVFTVK